MNPCCTPVNENRHDRKDACCTGNSGPSVRWPLRFSDILPHGLTPWLSLLMEPAQINCDGPAKQQQQQPRREQRYFHMRLCAGTSPRSANLCLSFVLTRNRGLG